jgi:hypoxanthine phosphoribosyltransferase
VEADIERILIHRDQIQQRVRSLAQEVAAVYERSSSGLTLVPILSGSIIFLADLIRELPLKMKVALAQVSTYPGRAVSAQRPRVVMDVNGDIAGREVLIVDDILDSGNTLRAVQALVGARQPVSTRTAVLLRKPEKAPADVPVDFVGFDIENLFIVGYGLDYDDHYRNYPHIGVLRRELMS